MLFKVSDNVLVRGEYVPSIVNYAIKETLDGILEYSMIDLPDGTLMRIVTYSKTNEDTVTVENIHYEKLLGVKVVVDENNKYKLYDENKNPKLSDLFNKGLVDIANKEEEYDNENTSDSGYDSSTDSSEDESVDEQIGSKEYNQSECIERDDSEIRNDESEDEIESDDQSTENDTDNRGYEEDDIEEREESREPGEIITDWFNEESESYKRAKQSDNREERTIQRNDESKPNKIENNKPNKHFVGNYNKHDYKNHDKTTYHPNRRDRETTVRKNEAVEAVHRSIDKNTRRYDFDFKAIVENAYNNIK